MPVRKLANPPPLHTHTRSPRKLKNPTQTLFPIRLPSFFTACFFWLPASMSDVPAPTPPATTRTTSAAAAVSFLLLVPWALVNHLGFPREIGWRCAAGPGRGLVETGRAQLQLQLPSLGSMHRLRSRGKGRLVVCTQTGLHKSRGKYRMMEERAGDGSAGMGRMVLEGIAGTGRRELEGIAGTGRKVPGRIAAEVDRLLLLDVVAFHPREDQLARFQSGRLLHVSFVQNFEFINLHSFCCCIARGSICAFPSKTLYCRAWLTASASCCRAWLLALASCCWAWLLALASCCRAWLLALASCCRAWLLALSSCCLTRRSLVRT